MNKKRVLIFALLLLMIFLISCVEDKINCDYSSVSSFLNKADLMGYLRNSLPQNYRELDECNSALHMLLAENEYIRNFCVNTLQDICTEKTFTQEGARDICNKYIDDYVDNLVEKCQGKQLYCCNCYGKGLEQNMLYIYKNTLVSSEQKCQDLCKENTFMLNPTDYACNPKCPEGMELFKVNTVVTQIDNTEKLDTLVFCCAQGTTYSRETRNCEPVQTEEVEDACPVKVQQQ